VARSSIGTNTIHYVRLSRVTSIAQHQSSFNMQLNLLQRAGTILLMVPLLVTSFNSVHKQTAFRTNTVHRNMLPADFLSDPSFLNHLNLLDSSSSSQLLEDASTLLDPSTFSDASQILADAAAELGDAAVEAEKTGLWEQYLAIFKGALNLVHSTIDQPLRSVGITQTWGISIAIFTAGKYTWTVQCGYMSLF
jgi:hypothetical protein